ncbi:TolC family protein, partial [bacterium]|nr:TolC family protein [bacterium]
STEHFVLSAIEKYLEWVHLHERNKLTQKQLDVATKSLKLLKRKYRDNLIEKLDVLRQEDAIRSIKHEQLSIQASITSITAGLALLSNKDPELFSLPELSLNTPIPINKTLTFSATKAARLFESKTKFTKLQQQQLLETKKSNLDLGLTYGILSGDNSFNDSLNFDKHDQRVSLVYTKKLQNRSLTKELENINHELEKINAQKNEHNVNFNIEKKTLLSQIKSYNDIIELSKRQLQSNTDTLTEEKRLYYIGKSNLTFVLQAETNLHRAQSQHIQHLYNFQRLHIQYLTLTDTLLSRYLPMSIL